MKKLAITICLLVLLGQAPLEEWKKVDQMEFLHYLAKIFLNSGECGEEIGVKVKVGSVIQGDQVLFFGECLERKVEM